MLTGIRKVSCSRVARNAPHKEFRTLSTAAESSSKSKPSKLHKGVQRDLKRGNLWEYGQLKKHPDGKVWEGKELLSEHNMMWPQELYRFRGKGLIKKNEVNLEETFSGAAATLVMVSQKRPFAVKQIESWTLPMREKHPLMPIADLTISQNFGYWWLTPVLAQIWSAQDRVGAIFGYKHVSSLRNLTAEEFGIDIENGFLSYQFVVDSDAKIRWLSVGSAEQSDLDRVSSVIRKLQAEYNTRPKSKVPRVANLGKQATDKIIKNLDGSQGL